MSECGKRWWSCDEQVENYSILRAQIRVKIVKQMIDCAVDQRAEELSMDFVDTHFRHDDVRRWRITGSRSRWIRLSRARDVFRFYRITRSVCAGRNWQSDVCCVRCSACSLTKPRRHTVVQNWVLQTDADFWDAVWYQVGLINQSKRIHTAWWVASESDAHAPALLGSISSADDSIMPTASHSAIG